MIVKHYFEKKRATKDKRPWNDYGCNCCMIALFVWQCYSHHLCILHYRTPSPSRTPRQAGVHLDFSKDFHSRHPRRNWYTRGAVWTPGSCKPHSESTANLFGSKHAGIISSYLQSLAMLMQSIVSYQFMVDFCWSSKTWNGFCRVPLHFLSPRREHKVSSLLISISRNITRNILSTITIIYHNIIVNSYSTVWGCVTIVSTFVVRKLN